jgi:hypothetical protein
MSPVFELAAQLDVVVDLPVERHDEIFLSSDHRLVSTLEVDDCQAAVAYEKGCIGAYPATVAVGSTMRQRVDHSLQVALLTLSPKTGDAAHV